MINVCRLTRRHTDTTSQNMPRELEQVKIFSLSIGHGIGTVDFVETIETIEEEAYDQMLKECGAYAQFKLGNLSQYFEIEVFPEHAQKLYHEMPECFLKELFGTLHEGYVILRKSL